MLARLILLTSLSAVLTGCALNTSCVAIDDPNEIRLTGRVSGKEQVPGPVVIRPPKAVQVTDQLPDGANAAMAKQVLTALVAPNAKAVISPGSAFADNMADASLHSGDTVEANPEAVVGKPCDQEDQVLTDGATRYSVDAADGRYVAHSAYAGFDIGDCVTLLLTDTAGVRHVRIARSNACSKSTNLGSE